MNFETMLSSLKIDLGITSTAYDARLIQYLKTAYNEIMREGATLSADSIDDQNLVVMYAAWMWNKRESGEGIPRMIRWQINNRLFDLEV